MKNYFLKILVVFLTFILMSCSYIVDSSKESTSRINPQRLAEVKSVIEDDFSSIITKEAMMLLLSESLNNDYDVSISDSSLIQYSDTKLSRSIQDDNNQSTLYICDITNKSTSEKGFAITSNDRKLGPVLAIVPSCEFGENDLSLFLVDKIINYVAETDEALVYLDENYSYRLAEKQEQAETGKYKFKNFNYNNGNSTNMLYTAWKQRGEYNYIVNKELGDGNDYPSGCGPIALGQIFTKIRPITRCSLEKYNDVIYEWDKMIKIDATQSGKSVAVIDFKDSNVKKMIQVLLYEIGLGCKAFYTPTDTGVSVDGVKSYLDNIKLKYSYSDQYSYELIRQSIDNGSPVYVASWSHMIEYRWRKYYKIFGSKIKNSNWSTYDYKNGHAFVADAYANYTYDLYDMNDNYIKSDTSNFVHINMGWGSVNTNGYYLTGLFNTNAVPLSDKNNINRSGWHTDLTSTMETGDDYYYRYNTKLIYNFGL